MNIVSPIRNASTIPGQGARWRLEVSFLRHLEVYRDILESFDPSDPDAFPSLIQSAPDLRIRFGRVAMLTGHTTEQVRSWAMCRSVPDKDEQVRIVSELLRQVETHLGAHKAQAAMLTGAI